jgi:hypothetical protein
MPSLWRDRLVVHLRRSILTDREVPIRVPSWRRRPTRKSRSPLEPKLPAIPDGWARRLIGPAPAGTPGSRQWRAVGRRQ